MGMYIELKLIEDPKVTDEYLLKFAKSCIDFQNREGAKIYVNNQLGRIGTKETNSFCLKNKYDTFLLNSIFLDLTTYSKDREEIEVGRSGSHVWVHVNGEREFIVGIV